MAEDQGKPDEEKFAFTAEGEAFGYIALSQARVLAEQAARDKPARRRWIGRKKTVFTVLND